MKSIDQVLELNQYYFLKQAFRDVWGRDNMDEDDIFRIDELYKAKNIEIYEKNNEKYAYYNDYTLKGRNKDYKFLKEFLVNLQNGEILTDDNKIDMIIDKSHLQEREKETLFEYIITNGGIDITDDTYDMRIYCDFSIAEIRKNPFDACISNICKKLNIIEVKDNVLVCDILDFVKENIKNFESIVQMDYPNLSEEEIQEKIVCETIPLIMSGNNSNNFYKKLNDLLKNINKVEAEENER